MRWLYPGTHEAITTVLSSMMIQWITKWKKRTRCTRSPKDGRSTKSAKMVSWPLTWVSSRWQQGSTTRVASTTSAASRATAGTTNSWTKSARKGTGARRSLAATSISQRCTSVCPNASATNNVTVYIKPLTLSLANWLKELLSSAIFPKGRWSSRNKSMKLVKSETSDAYATAWCIMIG